MHSSGGAPRWLAAGIAALVLGVLGMYALGLHGVSATGWAAPGPAAAQAVQAQVPGASADHEAALDRAGAPGSQHGSDRHHGSDAVTGLCLAILAGGLLALGATLVRRARRGWRLVRTRSGRPVLPVAGCRVREHAPPPVWRYSVVRC